MTIRVQAATEDHAHSLLQDVRNDDRAEWMCGLLRGVEHSLPEALRYPKEKGFRRAALDDEGRCLLILGVSPSRLDPEVGTAWLIATNEAERRVFSLHRTFRRTIAEMHSLFPTLEAWPLSLNTLHREWLERMGFAATGEDARWGLGIPFLRYTRHQDYFVR